MSKSKSEQNESTNNPKDVVLQSETVLKSPSQDKIHEGQVSLTHGLVPFQPISASLSPEYKAWEESSNKLASLC